MRQSPDSWRGLKISGSHDQSVHMDFPERVLSQQTLGKTRLGRRILGWRLGGAEPGLPGSVDDLHQALCDKATLWHLNKHKSPVISYYMHFTQERVNVRGLA